VYKGFGENKIMENLDAERLNVIRDEALSRGRNVFEVNTTYRAADETALEIQSIINKDTFLAIDLTVPEEMKLELRKPIGKVFEDGRKALDFIRKRKGRLVSVGDACSYFLVSHEITPDMIIIDGKEKRRKFTKNIVYTGKVRSAKNPRGRITVDLWRTVEDAIKHLGKEKQKIVVDGEEDLAVLPVCMHCTEGTVVVYGQWDIGLVVAVMNKSTRERIKAIIENIMFMQ